MRSARARARAVLPTPVGPTRATTRWLSIAYVSIAGRGLRYSRPRADRVERLDRSATDPRIALRLPDVQARSARDHRRSARRPRLYRPDADRCRQVADLSDSRQAAPRDGAGAVAADLADEGSGGCTRTARLQGGPL